MTGDPYGKFGEEHLQRIAEGIKLYNAGLYWECHEELEHYWIDDIADNARNVYWAIIQVATALYHWRNSNLPGAQGMLRKAKEKLDRCETLKVETPMMQKFLSWDKFKKTVRAASNNSSLEDFYALAQFKFIDPSKWSYK